MQRFQKRSVRNAKQQADSQNRRQRQPAQPAESNKRRKHATCVYFLTKAEISPKRLSECIFSVHSRKDAETYGRNSGTHNPEEP